MGKLTAAIVKSLSLPGRYGDGGTLFLYIAPGGSKSWIQRVTINGKRRDIGLGGWPVVSLRKARERAFSNRVAIADGRDPLTEKRKTKVPTFREAAEATFEVNRSRWRNAKHTANWWSSIQKYAVPVLGDLPVDQIGREDVLRVLTPIWTTRPERASRLRQRIRLVLGWCQAHNHIPGDNVAGEGIDGALPAVTAVKRHYRAPPYQEVAEALKIVEASRASMAAKLCFRFTVLTAVRGIEARNATWVEVDLDARLWVIPPERMKGAQEHRVPLNDASLEVLEQARAIEDGSGLVFPSPQRPGRPLSDMALTKLLRDNGLAERTTVHGFRSSFRTWASEKTDAEHAVMELALAHQVGSAVERAYARSDLLSKRRELMDQWSDFVTGGAARYG